MTPRRQRMLAVGIVLVGVSLAVGLALLAFDENVDYFFSPTEVAEGLSPADRTFRLGGLVADDSVEREPGSLEMKFDVTDITTTMAVYYEGVLPDLFREGQGVVAIGRLQPDGSFRADEILAKHDENYMTPDVAEALAKQGHPVNNTTLSQSE